MKRITKVEEYLDHHQEHAEILYILRDVILESGLVETVKWGAPCYTLNKKNVVGLASFKSYVGLWFHQGSLLKDKDNVLINAQEGVTKALRQWKFDSAQEINIALLKKYLKEAIANEKAGLRIKSTAKKPLLIPVELKDAFAADPALKDQFKQFTPSKQREFAEYISQAKLEATRINRIQKIAPLIMAGIGLNDKYRK